MLSVIMLSVVMLSVVMLSVVMLNGMAPNADVESWNAKVSGREQRSRSD
jgi:hypothetical protein